ncbi:importin subunit alpha-8-like [Daphnia pulex]|uniref:importin subunit alpha-8-like n=1 Tax=Daphnia pulex TaxID=6669 RepID=UPI001EDF443A|nr:importin subunit alpha-8-like [Daphnia pulex]
MLDHNEDAVIKGALFAITTIYSVENPDWITAVINAGAIPRLMLLLDSPHAVVTVKASYTVVNIGTEEPEIRDKLIEQGLIKKLLNLIKANISVKLLRMVTSTLGSLSAHLINNNDEEILSGACWALFWLTDDPNKRMQEVVNAGVIPRLASLLNHNEKDVIDPTLKIIGKIVKGSDTPSWLLVPGRCCPNGNADEIDLKFSAIASLCTLLKDKEPETIEVVLDGLALILEAAVKMEELESFASREKVWWL